MLVLQEAPSDILSGSWTYISAPLETGSHAPCEHEGGFRGEITETTTAAVCCANHCDGANTPVVYGDSTGIDWVEHPGTFRINQVGNKADRT